MMAYATTGMMEPMLPAAGNRELEDLAVDLVARASGLAQQINPVVRHSLGDLVRSMNCYYSNLIEGHHTHPRDIDRALADDFSSNPEQRDLQLEARAHIEVQRLVDAGQIPYDIVSVDAVCWLHREFCRRLPEALLWVENPDTGRRLQVVPGELRDGNVSVGRHIPPEPEVLERFLRRFQEAYHPDRLSRVQQIISIPASHHRLLWIHPFFDGNGRVTRLFSHALVKQLGIGSSLWSVSRGLARRVGDYKQLLMAADQPRQGDLDGRGSLSAKAFNAFCAFFLKVCIDQIDYMASILEPRELLRRIELYTADEIAAERLPRGSFVLLREAFLAGEIERAQAAALTGYKERQARTVLRQLLVHGLLVSDSPRGPVRLGFPLQVVERWLPKLYPEL
jgi:Fic family protein